MLDWTTCGVVERHTGRVSGAWVFRGTRVPVSALFANLEGGATVEEFLEWFPGVMREQVNGVLEHAAHSLSTPEAAGLPDAHPVGSHCTRAPSLCVARTSG